MKTVIHIPSFSWFLLTESCKKTSSNPALNSLHVLISRTLPRSQISSWKSLRRSRKLIPIFIIFLPVCFIFLAFRLHEESLVSVCLLFTQDKSLIYFIRTINLGRWREKQLVSRCIKSQQSYEAVKNTFYQLYAVWGCGDKTCSLCKMNAEREPSNVDIHLLATFALLDN